LDEVVEGAAFLAFLALGLREGLLAGPCLGGCLGDTFLFAIDFLGGVLKEDMVGLEMKSAGALPLPTTGV